MMTAKLPRRRPLPDISGISGPRKICLVWTLLCSLECWFLRFGLCWQSNQLAITGRFSGESRTSKMNIRLLFYSSPQLVGISLHIFVDIFLFRTFLITFFLPYKRAGTHFSIHPAKRQHTPPSKKSQKSLENQNSHNWWSKSQVKKRFMPGYTGILSPRTYPSSSLPLQVADSLFKPTFASFFYFISTFKYTI